MAFIVTQSDLPQIFPDKDNPVDVNKIELYETTTLDDGDDFLHQYRLPVLVDLRNIIQTNAKKIQILTLKTDFNSIQRASRNLLRRLDDNQLNSSIMSYNENLIVSSLLNLKSQTIQTFDVDFQSFVNNQIANKIRELSDEEAFGTTDEIVTEAPDNVNKFYPNLTINLNDPYQQFVDLDSQKINFDLGSEALYSLGVDPASAFEPVEDELSFRKVKIGLQRKIHSKIKRESPNVSKFKGALRASFSELDPTKQVDNKYYTSDPSNFNFITYEIQESKRRQFIDFKFSIKQSDIDSNEGKIHLVVLLLDPAGIYLETFPVLIDQSRVERQSGLGLPYPDITMNAVRSGINKNIPCLSVRNNSYSRIKAKIYYKTTEECTSNILTRFSFLNEIELKPGESKKTYATDINSAVNNFESSNYSADSPSINTAGSIFFRAVVESANPRISRSTPTDNTFFTTLRSRKPEHTILVPMSVEISNDQSPNYITVTVKKIPLLAKSIVILKRDKTKKEKKFKHLKDLNRLNVPKVFGPFSNDQTIEFVDYDCRNDHVYEYKAFLEFGNNNAVSSINSEHVEFCLRNNFAFVIQDSIKTSVRAGGVRCTFRVSAPKSDLDNILSEIGSESFSLLENEMSNLKSLIDRNVVVDVYRYDLTYGESKKIRTVKPRRSQNNDNTESTILQGVFFDSETRKSGNYVYQLHPYVLGTGQLLAYLNNRLDKIIDSTPANMHPSKRFQRQKLKEIKKVLNELSASGPKYSSRSAIFRGTLQTDESALQNSGENLFYDGKTGAYTYIDVKTEINNVEFESPNIELIKMRYRKRNNSTLRSERFFNSAVLKKTAAGSSSLTLSSNLSNDDYTKTRPWAPLVTFTVTGDTDFVDYFIITCEKNGSTSVVGAVHNQNDENVIRYYDVSQIDYVGSINYYVTPIFQNNEVGERFFLGNIILKDKRRI